MVSSKWHSTLNIIFSNRFIKINSFIFYSCYRMRSFKKKSFLFCNTETKTSKAWHFCGLQPYETKPILTILTAIIIQHNEKRKITTKQNVLVLVWLLPRRKKKQILTSVSVSNRQTRNKHLARVCVWFRLRLTGVWWNDHVVIVAYQLTSKFVCVALRKH